MNRAIIVSVFILIACAIIIGFRFAVLTHIKLGLETEFYETAIEFIKEQKKCSSQK